MSANRLMQVNVYEIAMSNLGIERLESPEQFAELYEYVTNNYDLFNDETDEWPGWASEVQAVLDDGLEPRSWFISKLQQGHDVRSLSYFLCGEFGYDWPSVRSYLTGRSDSLLNDKLPEPEDWFRFQNFLRECSMTPTYREVRRFFGARSGEKPHGRTVVLLCDRFGAVCVNDEGGPLNFRKRG